MKRLVRATLCVIILLCVINCEQEDSPNSVDLGGDNETGRSVSVSFTTTTANGAYAPAHTQAVWVSDSDGNIVKTLGRWADKYIKTLSWYSLEDADTDVKTGASKQSHGDISISGWNLEDKDGNLLEAGEYQLNIEYNETNSVSKHKVSTSVFEVYEDSVALMSKDETSYIYDIEMMYSGEDVE